MIFFEVLMCGNNEEIVMRVIRQGNEFQTNKI